MINLLRNRLILNDLARRNAAAETCCCFHNQIVNRQPLDSICRKNRQKFDLSGSDRRKAAADYAIDCAISPSLPANQQLRPSSFSYCSTAYSTNINASSTILNWSRRENCRKNEKIDNDGFDESIDKLFTSIETLSSGYDDSSSSWPYDSTLQHCRHHLRHQFLLKNPSEFGFNYRLYFLQHNFGHLNRRYLHTSPNLHLTPSPKKKPEPTEEQHKARSRVDETLKLLKEELEHSEKEDERLEAAKKQELESKKQTWREWLKDGLMHYYHGFRLFFIEIRVSTRLLARMLRGQQLTRQEKLQLARSAADLFRFVPFLVFIIVPFMEFLLPFYLKLFPGALPSTFQERSKEDEKIRQQLKLKLEMAKFLQETVSELATERKKKGAVDSKISDFSSFLKTIREGGGYVSNTKLLNYSKLFEDELTLDNLSEAQLRALCRIVGITPIGVANILRFQLSMKLNELKADDRLIYKEGVENLSVQELQAACRARGMRSVGVSEERLRQQLNQWLELSFNEKVPPSLLLLSSTLYLPEEVSFSDRLKTIMSTLPAHLADEVKSKIVENESSSLDTKSKFELLKSIESILKREKEARDKQQQLVHEKRVKELELANLEVQAKVIEEQQKKHEAVLAEEEKIRAVKQALRKEEEKAIFNSKKSSGDQAARKSEETARKNDDLGRKVEEAARLVEEATRQKDEIARLTEEVARKNEELRTAKEEELRPKVAERLVGLKDEELRRLVDDEQRRLADQSEKAELPSSTHGVDVYSDKLAPDATLEQEQKKKEKLSHRNNK